MADEQKKKAAGDDIVDTASFELDEMLYARHVEIESLKDLMTERGTPIPALFSSFYKFIQNPSAVSVETFKRMIDTDDTIGSGMDFLTTCLAARLGSYVHPSEEITKFVNQALDQIQGGWMNTLKEILSASWAGFYVGEKVWMNDPKGFLIEKIIPLPPTTVLFEVERTGEITYDGILQYQRNWNPATLSQGIGFFGGIAAGSGFAGATAPDPFARFGDLPFPLRTANTFNYLSIRIPRLKCIHYAFDAQGKLGNPYGRSVLRRIYKYYVLKDTFLQMMAIALDRKGTPATVIFADPNTTLKDPSKVNAAGNQKGQRVGIDAATAARDIFKHMHNDSVFVLPGKKGQIFDIESLETDSNAEVFIQALDFCNKSMLRGMLIPALIFGNGDGTGSYSLGQEHARTFDKILDGVLSGLIPVLKHQIVKELIAYNFPRSAWEKDGLGDFGKREMTQDERDKEMDVAQKAADMGAVDMTDLEDLNQVRERAGFQPRTTPIPKENLPGFGEDENDDGKGGEGDDSSGESEE